MLHHSVLLKVMKLLSFYIFFIYNFFISDLLGWAFGSNSVDQPSDLWVKIIRKAVINIELVRLPSLIMNLISFIFQQHLPKFLNDMWIILYWFSNHKIYVKSVFYLLKEDKISQIIMCLKLTSDMLSLSLFLSLSIYIHQEFQ